MTERVCGYGVYEDDAAHIGCPRARSDMTPCIARDGDLALDDHTARKPVCVGCGEQPLHLFKELAEMWPPARHYLQTKDPRHAANRLAQMVRDSVIK